MEEGNKQNQYFNILDNLLEDHREEISTSRLCSLFHINPIQSRSLIESYIRHSKKEFKINLLISGILLNSTKSFILTNQFSLKDIKNKFYQIKNIQIYSLTLQHNNSYSHLSWQKEIKELSQFIKNSQNSSIWVPEYTFFHPMKSNKRRELFDNSISSQKNNINSNNLVQNSSSAKDPINTESSPSISIPYSSTELNKSLYNNNTFKSFQVKQSSNEDQKINSEKKISDTSFPKFITLGNSPSHTIKSDLISISKVNNETKRKKRSSIDLSSPPNKIQKKSFDIKNKEEKEFIRNLNNELPLFESDDDLDMDEHNSEIINDLKKENSLNHDNNMLLENNDSIMPPITIKQRIMKDVTFQKDGYLVIEKASMLETKQVQEVSSKTLTTPKKSDSLQKPKLQQGILAYFKKKS